MKHRVYYRVLTNDYVSCILENFKEPHFSI